MVLTDALYVFVVCLCYGIIFSPAAAICTTSRGQSCCDGYFKNNGKCQLCRGGTFGNACSQICTCKASEECHHVTGNCTPRQPGQSISSLFPKNTDTKKLTDMRTSTTQVAAGGMKNLSLRSKAASTTKRIFLDKISSTLVLISVYKTLEL